MRKIYFVVLLIFVSASLYAEDYYEEDMHIFWDTLTHFYFFNDPIVGDSIKKSIINVPTASLANVNWRLLTYDVDSEIKEAMDKYNTNYCMFIQRTLGSGDCLSIYRRIGGRYYTVNFLLRDGRQI